MRVVEGAPGSRILFLLHSLGRNGADVMMSRVATELRRKRLPVHLGYLNPPHTLRSQLDEELPVVCFERRGKISPRAVFRLARYLRENKIEFVLCVDMYAMLYAYLARHFGGVGRLRYSVCINQAKLTSMKQHLQMTLYRWILRGAERIVFGCAAQRSDWVQRFHLNPQRCTFVYNGVDLSRFCEEEAPAERQAERSRLRIPDEAIVLGIVANHRPWKRLPFFLQAINQLARQDVPVWGVVAGAGSDAAELRDLVRRLRIEDRVHLLGSLDEVRPLLAAMDIFALTSTMETFSNAALEAMAAGKPVVLPRVDGLPEMIEHEATGLLYSAPDFKEFVAHVQTLALDSAKRKRLGLAARALVKRQFTIDHTVGAYADVVKAFLGTAGWRE